MTGQPTEEAATLAPWPYSAEPPQRYRGNLDRYRARGGLVRLGTDVRGFIDAQDGNRTDMARFYFFCLAEDQIRKEGLEGDIAELGVYRGNTAIVLATTARRLGRTLYLLDTFEGFPERDLTGIDADKPMGFGDTSLESVRARVGDDHVRFIKGYFPDTAADLAVDARYCLVHIDCDLYAPAKSALSYFYPRLVPGGFLVVHDYSSLHWNGAERAVDEFFANRPESIVPITDSAGSVVVRKIRDHPGTGNWLLQRKAALVGAEWSSTAHGRLSELLPIGWGAPEPWGVWGVGEFHVLELWLRPVAGAAIELDADVQAALLGSRHVQHVEIFINGRRLAEWEFTTAANRGVRRVRVPAELIGGRPPEDGIALLKLEFRPRSVTRPRDLEPRNPDGRPLGMALHRLRYRRVAEPSRPAAQEPNR